MTEANISGHLVGGLNNYVLVAHSWACMSERRALPAALATKPLYATWLDIA